MLNNLTSSTRNNSASEKAEELSKEITKLSQRVDDIQEQVDDMSTSIVTEQINTDNIEVNNTVDASAVVADSAVIQGATISQLSTNNAEIDTATIRELQGSTEAENLHVENLEVDNITGVLRAEQVSTDRLSAGVIDDLDGLTTANLTATEANVGTLQADDIDADAVVADSVDADAATIDAATIDTATVSTLNADTASATNLSATNANLTNVEAQALNTVMANVQALEIKSVKATGKINLSPELQTPTDWYTLTIPAFKNAVIFLNSTYNNKDWSVTISMSEDTAFIQWTSADLGIIKDFSYDPDQKQIKIRFQGTEYLNYGIISSDTDREMSVAYGAVGDEYPVIYVPDTRKGYTFKTYETGTNVDGGYKFSFNGIADLSGLQVQSFIMDSIYVKHAIFLNTVTSLDDTEEMSSGNENGYISNVVDEDNRLVPSWRDAADNTTGLINKRSNLVTERSIAAYNGTVDPNITLNNNEHISSQGGTFLGDPLPPVYPITNLGDDTTVHGDSTTEGVATFEGNVVTEASVKNADETYKINSADGSAKFSDLDVTNDLRINGDLYVSGTSHIVSEEDIESEGDIITVRANKSAAMASGEIAGLLVNKYDGTNSLTVGSDHTGTLRTGTAAGTSTNYTDIAYNSSTKKWYDIVSGEYVEMATQPVGEMVEWTDKVENDPYTEYATAVFLQIDPTTLQPIATRAEESAMENSYAAKWDSTNTKLVTAGTTCVHSLDVDSTGTINTPNITATCATVTNANVTNLTSSCHINTGNSFVCGDTYICGDLTVCGIVCAAETSAVRMITQHNEENRTVYPVFALRDNPVDNPAAECIYTNCSISFNPYSGSVTAVSLCGSHFGLHKGNIWMEGFGSSADRPIMIACPKDTNGYSDIGYSTCCSLTFNPNTGVVKAATFCGALSGNASTATNSTCFGGCTFAQACTAIRSGLTSCTGTVTVANSTSTSAVPIALCTGATAIGRSTCYTLTFTPTTAAICTSGNIIINSGCCLANVSIGYNAYVCSNSSNSVAIGTCACAYTGCGVAIGNRAMARNICGFTFSTIRTSCKSFLVLMTHNGSSSSTYPLQCIQRAVQVLSCSLGFYGCKSVWTGVNNCYGISGIDQDPSVQISSIITGYSGNVSCPVRMYNAPGQAKNSWVYICCGDTAAAPYGGFGGLYLARFD